MIEFVSYKADFPGQVSAWCKTVHFPGPTVKNAA
jgi:hypothetical protein